MPSCKCVWSLLIHGWRPLLDELKIEFSLFFRPKDTKITGFDRLYLEASTSIRFSSTLLNDIPVAVEDAVNESGFEVTFPQLLGDDNLVELRFAAHIFQQSTPFNLFIQDSRDGSTSRQRVDSGDATDRVLSSTNLVRLPVKPDLLLNVTFDSLVLTPNGDGINDAIAVQTDIVNILVPRPLRLRLYDLAGRQLTERSEAVTAGAQRLVWDGQDESGNIVPPGLYLLELHIAGDARQQRVRRLVSVVY